MTTMMRRQTNGGADNRGREDLCGASRHKPSQIVENQNSPQARAEGDAGLLPGESVDTEMKQHRN